MAIFAFLQNYQILSSIIVLFLLAYGHHILLVNAGPSEPPLIKGYIPFLGAALEAILSPPRFLASCKAKYGDIFTVYALGFRINFVADPIQGIPAVFKNPKQLSFKATLQQVYLKILGFSLERAKQEDLNREHFQMMKPYLLASSAVHTLTQRFQRCLLQDIRQEIMKNPEFKNGMVVDLFDWAGRRLFFSSASAMYGDGVLDGADTFVDDFRKFDKDFPLRIMLPTWLTQGFVHARSRIQRLFASKFERGLKDPSDFMKRRIEIQTNYGYSMEEIGSDVLGITFGMMTNTIPISFWYIAFLLSSKKHYDLVLERIRSYVLPNATLESDNIFHVPALVADPLLQACFQETLRLRIQNGSTRVVVEPTMIPVNGKEYHLRKRSIVFIPTTLIHLDEEIYSNANQYQPERFLGADLESSHIITNEHTVVDEEKKPQNKSPKFFKKGIPVKHYLMPFGGGDNLCTGRRFAQNEVITMGCTILYLFEFENPKGGKLCEPTKPSNKRYGVAADGPGKPYTVKMRLRENLLGKI